MRLINWALVDNADMLNPFGWRDGDIQQSNV
jgi:hypothetical protein